MLLFKKIVTTTFLCLVIFVLNAQVDKATKKEIKKILKTADEMFANLQFNNAVDEYHKALQLDPNDLNIRYKLAESYRTTRDYAKAKEHYEKIVAADPDAYPTSRFWLAKIYKIEGEYDKSDRLFREFKSGYDEFDFFYNLTKNELQGNKIARDLSESPRDIKIQHLGSNINEAGQNDFSAIELPDKTLMFTGVAQIKGVEVDDPDSINVARLFVAKRDGDGYEKRKLFEVEPKDDPGKHMGSASLAPDSQRIYYTECEDGDAGRLCAIYYSDLNRKGEWSDPKDLGRKVNVNNYTSKHPMLFSYPDDPNQYLLFSSDIDGGEGGFDLWYVIIDEKQKISDPINLGKRVNTQWDERSPFFDLETSTLYFASNGHWGLGEFDNFGAEGDVKSNKWKKPINLGFPINSTTDDYYLSISPSRDFVYFTSNRADENSNNETCCDNIFRTPYKEYTLELVDKTNLVTIMGKLSSSDAKALKKVKVTLLDENGDVVSETSTNTSGKFKFKDLEPEKDYSILLEEIDELFNSDILLTDYKKKILKKTVQESDKEFKFTELPEENHDIYLLDFENPEPKAEPGNVNVIGKVVDKNDPVEAIGDLTVFLESNNEVVDSTKTDQFGKFQFANIPDENYQVRLDDHISVLMAEMLMTNDHGSTIKTAKIEEGNITEEFKGMPLMQSSVGMLDTEDPGVLDLVSISGVVLLDDMDVATVYLLNEEGEHLDTTETDILGRYEFNDLSPDETYSVEIAEAKNAFADLYLKDKDNNILQKGYQYSDEGFKFKELDTSINSVSLIDIDNPELFEFEGDAEIIGRVVDKKNPAFGAKGVDVYLLDKPQNIIDSTKTDHMGQFKFDNLKEDKDYFVKVDEPKKDDYFDRLNEYVEDLFTEMLMVNADNEIISSATSDGRTEELYSFKALKKPVKTKHLSIAKAEVGTRFTLNNILFETNKYDLLPASYQELEKLITQMKEHEDVNIEITGHTDNVGSRVLNKELSEKRAEAVLKHLTKNGINKSRLVAKGYGSDIPVASNDSDFGRKQNRRVEITIRNREQ